MFATIFSSVSCNPDLGALYRQRMPRESSLSLAEPLACGRGEILLDSWYFQPS